MGAIIAGLLETLLALVFAFLVVAYSLRLLSRQAQPAPSFGLEQLDQEIDRLLAGFRWTPIEILRLVTKLLRYKWRAGRRSVLGWADFLISFAAISLAIPGWRDLVILGFKFWFSGPA